MNAAIKRASPAERDQQILHGHRQQQRADRAIPVQESRQLIDPRFVREAGSDQSNVATDASVQKRETHG
jgi:hypothetical protein